MSKTRLDVLMVEKGLAESRAKAQALIMAGQVRVGGEVELRPGRSIEPDTLVEIERGPRFVSRGGEKLEAALEAFGVAPAGRVCADVGASTGGFTDCLLQHGAGRVYAIDVGKGILHWSLRNDPRVVVMEETNARFLELLPEPISLVTIDASFISLKLLLPAAVKWLEAPAGTPPEKTGEIIALIKPQFEAGRQDVARGDGVIRDPFVHRQVLLEVLSFAQKQGLGIRGLIRSPLLGPKGNLEFLAWMQIAAPRADLQQLVNRAAAAPAKAEN